MKRLKLILLVITMATLGACSSDDSGSDDTDVSILGRWDLKSDKWTNSNGDVEELMTVCKLEYWYFDFKNNTDLVWGASSDEPGLDLLDCKPDSSSFKYKMDDDILTITDSRGTEILIIELLSEDTLIVRSQKDEFGHRQFTFKK